ncbi:MAG: hypothetical protein K0S16_1455 [Moraxellaceae bacterium]|jgi:CRP-like cAMP-binding protein|nr:hypothetical protein [Moraxellaceae bacterium]
MTRLTEDQLASVRSSLWFSTLPLPLQDFLATHGRVMQLAAGQRLFARDASADGLYNVIDGGIRISALATDGREAILAILGAPQWFGEIALFDDLQRTHDAMAERPTTLLHIPARALHELLAEQPAYWRDFGRLMAQKLRLLFNMAEIVVMLPAPQRVARVLMAISEGYGERRAEVGQTVQVSQEQLGRMVSLTRQSTNQILRQFADDGAIRLVRGGFQLADVQKLRALSV